jgi:hypothetical protein
MMNRYAQYLADLNLTNGTDEDQCLDVQFRFFSPQFTEEALLRIIEDMDKLSDGSVLDVCLNSELIFNN